MTLPGVWRDAKKLVMHNRGQRYESPSPWLLSGVDPALYLHLLPLLPIALAYYLHETVERLADVRDVYRTAANPPEALGSAPSPLPVPTRSHKSWWRRILD